MSGKNKLASEVARVLIETSRWKQVAAYKLTLRDEVAAEERHHFWIAKH